MSNSGSSKHKRNKQLEFDFNSEYSNQQTSFYNDENNFKNQSNLNPEVLLKKMQELESLSPVTKIKVIVDGDEIIYDPKEKDLKAILDGNIRKIRGYVNIIDTQMTRFKEDCDFRYYRTVAGLLNFLINKVYKEFEEDRIRKEELLEDNEGQKIITENTHLVGVLYFARTFLNNDREIKSKIRILEDILKALHKKRSELKVTKDKVISKNQHNLDLYDISFF